MIRRAIKTILSSFFSIRLRDELLPLELRLLAEVSNQLPPYLAEKLMQQTKQIKFIDRYDPKHYIACFTGKAGSFYSTETLFPSSVAECRFASVRFKVEGFEVEFHAKLHAVRGGFWGFEITPFFKKILHQDDLNIQRVRVYPELLDESYRKKA